MSSVLQRTEHLVKKMSFSAIIIIAKRSSISFETILQFAIVLKTFEKIRREKPTNTFWIVRDTIIICWLPTALKLYFRFSFPDWTSKYSID